MNIKINTKYQISNSIMWAEVRKNGLFSLFHENLYYRIKMQKAHILSYPKSKKTNHSSAILTYANILLILFCWCVNYWYLPWLTVPRYDWAYIAFLYISKTRLLMRLGMRQIENARKYSWKPWVIWILVEEREGGVNQWYCLNL